MTTEARIWDEAVETFHDMRLVPVFTAYEKDNPFSRSYARFNQGQLQIRFTIVHHYTQEMLQVIDLDKLATYLAGCLQQWCRLNAPDLQLDHLVVIDLLEDTHQHWSRPCKIYPL